MSLAPEERITLDRTAFKALASNTRVNILKALEANQRTVSELARELSMNKATMYQHLEQLKQAGLVKRLDGSERLKTLKAAPHQAPVAGPPRKWVYYKLTFKGKNVVNPGKVKFAIMLTVVGVMAIAVILLLFANVMFANQQGPTYTADVTPPAIDNWDAKSPTSTDTQFSFSVQIFDLPATERERISGLDPASIRFYYGFADREEGTTPNLQDWAEVEHTVTGSVYQVRMKDLDLTQKGGMYIYLKVEVRDQKGNMNESYKHVYVISNTEPDLKFGPGGAHIDGGGGGARYSYTIDFQLTNVGDEDAGQFMVEVYTADIDTIEKGGGVYVNYRLLSVRIQGLKVGEVRNTTEVIDITKLRYLENDPSKGGGVYFVIDINDEVKELDEDNNVLRVAAPPQLEDDLDSDAAAKSDRMEGAPGFEALTVVVAATLAIMFRYRNRRPERD